MKGFLRYKNILKIVVICFSHFASFETYSQMTDAEIKMYEMPNEDMSKPGECYEEKNHPWKNFGKLEVIYCKFKSGKQKISNIRTLGYRTDGKLPIIIDGATTPDETVEKFLSTYPEIGIPSNLIQSIIKSNVYNDPRFKKVKNITKYKYSQTHKNYPLLHENLFEVTVYEPNMIQEMSNRIAFLPTDSNPNEYKINFDKEAAKKIAFDSICGPQGCHRSDSKETVKGPFVWIYKGQYKLVWDIIVPSGPDQCKPKDTKYMLVNAETGAIERIIEPYRTCVY